MENELEMGKTGTKKIIWGAMASNGLGEEEADLC